ncbi:MAG: hypothetical protein M1834_003005 [Cirrosporium novae-zelandiae]|nr:MAG: hypothetical protein M1834_003005 [Cirrosporium novae-zelandiae]
MSLLNIPVLAGVSLLLLCLYRFLVYPIFLSPLSKIPTAHPTSAISPLWILSLRYGNLENQTLHRLHTEKGPILRIGPNELSVNCVDEGIRTIYGGGFEKHDFYVRLFKNYGVFNMFSTPWGKPHSTRKRMLSNIYSKSVVQSSPTARAAAKIILFDRFLPILDASADTGTPINIHELNFGYTMDTFTAYQFGLNVSTNFIQDEATRKWWLGLFQGRRSYTFWPQELPGLTSWLRKLGIRIVPKFVDNSNRDLEAFTLRMCDNAETLLSEKPSQPPETTPAIYSQLREALKKRDSKTDIPITEGPQPYPNRLAIASEMLDHNAAAHETSGITLTYLYHELSQRPASQIQLRQELLTLSPPLFYSPDSSRELPDPKALDALPLLHAMLMETLRLHAAIPGIQPRITPQTPCRLAGYDNIPPNVRVQSSAYLLHRNPEIFPDPEQWKPERWLDAEPTQLQEMNRWFWAFGSGGRMCIGSNFAMNSMKHAIAAIYTNFTTSIIDDEGIEQEDGYTVGPRGNKLVLKFERV